MKPNSLGGIHVAAIASDFELVKEFELERLVRVANEGMAALCDLQSNHPDAYEAQQTHSFGKTIEKLGFSKQTGFGIWKFRIKPTKPQPAFEPFYVGKPKYVDGVGCEVGQWQVVHLPDTGEMKIGCQTFLVAKLLEALASVSEYGGIYSLGEKGTLFSMKDGVRLESSSNHKLSWADADRLLEALRKVPSSERKAA